MFIICVITQNCAITSENYLSISNSSRASLPNAASVAVLALAASGGPTCAVTLGFAALAAQQVNAASTGKLLIKYPSSQVPDWPKSCANMIRGGKCTFEPCHASCKTCSASGSSACLSCKSNAAVVDGTNACECNDGKSSDKRIELYEDENYVYYGV